MGQIKDKKFRNLLIAVLVFSTLASFVPDQVSANTQPTVGGACTRVGSSKSVGGIKYSCSKTRGKLVWIAAKPSKKVVALPVTPVVAHISKVGAACTLQGEEITSVEKLVCRQVLGNQNKYFLVEDPVVSVVNPTSLSNLATCRLPDMRTLPVQPPDTSITFPLTPRPGSVKQGVQTIAVVGFDFVDAPGTGNPLDIYGSQLETAKTFFDWYSNGKVTLNFRRHDKWIRLNGSAARFKTGEHFEAEGELTIEQMAREYFSAVKAQVEVSDVTAIWFVYPKDIKQLQYNFGMSGGSYGLPAMYGFGPYKYSGSLPIWTYFVHELLHEQGLQGHSPKAPWFLGVMLNDSSPSQSLNTWDELVLDWMQESEIYCVERSSLSVVELELAPIEKNQAGLHNVMVKLNDHQVLVIESHRRGLFSPGMPSGIYGLTIQLVDTTRATTWSDDQATSVYLQIDKGHQKYPAYGTAVVNGRDEKSGVAIFGGVGVSQAAFGIDMSYFLLEGETFTTNGVKITFVKSRYTDRISLSVAN